MSYEGTDTSLTASTSTYSYALPSTIDNIRKIIITSGSIDYPVGKSEWVEEGGNIYFENRPQNGGTMKLFGRKQYTIADSVPDKYLNYILYSAAVKAYEMLLNKYSAGLLMSEVTQPELVSSLAYYSRRRNEEESKLDNKVMVSY